MIKNIYKDNKSKSIFRLKPGFYFANNLLGDYDCLESFGRCNNKCVFCCDSDNYKDNKSLLIKPSSSPNGKILLCCGEPTNIKNVVKTVKNLKNKYTTVAISTNGRKLADLKFLRAMISAGVNEAFFSIHGHEAAVHDSITGVEGSFAQSVKGLKNALKLQAEQGGLEIAVNAVITTKNLPFLRKYLVFLYKLGIRTVNLDLPVPLGAAAKSYRKIMPQYANVALEFEKALEGCCMNGMMIFVSNLPLCVFSSMKGVDYSLILNESLEFTKLRCSESGIVCADCIASRVCPGAFKDYVDIYGDREFKALSEIGSKEECILKSNIDNLAVVITCKCQLDCLYCYQDRDRPDLSEEELYASIDLLFTSPSDEIELQFFGGEPLLRLDLIKKGIKYAQKKKKETGKQIRYLLTTNGLLLDRDLLKFLKEQNVTIMLSLDGNCRTHLRNRPLKHKKPANYFTRLSKILRLIREVENDYFINMVFLPRDIKGLNLNLSYLIKAGVKDIQVAYAVGVMFKDSDIFACVKAFNRLKEVALKSKVNLRNIYTDNEPVLSSPQIMVTAGGAIYVGCGILLEKLFPKFSRIFYSGDLRKITSIFSLKRSRQEQLALILKNIHSLSPELLSNLYLGVVLSLYSLTNSLIDDYTLLASNKPKPVGNYLYRDKMLLMLTYQCQMGCSYCRMDRSHPEMPAETLYKAIDLLLTSPEQEVELQFFGGEPLLRFDLIKKGISYAEKEKRKVNKKIRYLVTTNGLLIDKEKLDFLSGYNVSFLLSIDGDERTQKANRPLIGGREASYPFGLLREKMVILSKAKCNYFINFVIRPQNIPYLLKNVHFFLKNGSRNLRFSYELGAFWQQERIFEYFLNVFRAVLKFSDGFDCSIINIGADDEPFLVSPALTMDYDGKIYSGCTLTLEGKFPDLKKINLVGEAGKIDSISEIRRSKSESIYSIVNFYPPKSTLRRVILNNLFMGEISGSFFSSLFNLSNADKPK
ncbi:MAG: radical SAM protein [Candidatus Omnitrophica bacterium]|nr:radical SAM protein [Candidatus Omnitrophota bacterium]MDD5664823.1 radical SAM protein [Candidatus Omnitrophota bacterium]